MKATYDIGVKRKSRNFIFNFSVNNVINPKTSKVLCFPGHECLEIFDIWDKLGVPRKNITCLERDAEAFREIFDRKLGCTVLKMEFNDFANCNTEAFDIISLDFQGQVGTFYPYIKKLLSKSVAKRTVLITAFSGRRETKQTKNEQFNSFLTKAITSHEPLLDLLDSHDIFSNTRQLRSELRQYIEKELQPSKYMDNIKLLLLKCFGSGSEDLLRASLLDKEFRNLPSYKELVNVGTADAVKKLSLQLQGQIYLRSVITDNIKCLLHKRRASSVGRFKSGSSVNNKNSMSIESAADLLETVFSFKTSNLYALTECSSYKYVSDGNTPMYIDCLCVDKKSAVPILPVNAQAKTLNEFFSFLLCISDGELNSLLLSLEKFCKALKKKQSSEKELLTKLRAFIGFEKHQPKFMEDVWTERKLMQK